MAKGFYKVENVSDSKSRYHINGIIGDWGNSSEDIIWHIESNKAKDLEIIIQSPGGSAFEGIAIHNALVNHNGQVTTRVLGAAASAGSIIFMAGAKRIMPRNTYLMIHEPTLSINGRARDLREAADFLDGLTDALRATYGPHLNVSDDELMAMLMKDSWINAEDATAMGFATGIDEPLEAVALAPDFAHYVNSLPEALTECAVKSTVNNIATIKDLENCLRESGGFSKSLATALVGRAKAILQSESVDEARELLDVLNNFKCDLNVRG